MGALEHIPSTAGWIFNTKSNQMTSDEFGWKGMPYCPKCGAEVSEEIRFCTKCGATLRHLPPPERREKEEKHEKREKSEKAEKHEKGEYGYLGQLISGIVLIVVGLMAYLHAISPIYARSWGSFLLIVVGVIIVVIAINAARTAAGRSPKP